DELDATETRIRPGVGAAGFEQHGATQRMIADRLESDLRDFAHEHGLDDLVVVDVSSTEQPAEEQVLTTSLDEVEAALDAGRSPLPVSSLYAYAALRAGCPVVAFTPSPGPALPVVAELAERVGLPWAGSDGKTGETLLKTVLG